MNKIRLAVGSPRQLQELSAANPGRYPFLLQSTATSGALGRFDILFAFPGQSLELRSSGEIAGRNPHQHERFLDALNAWYLDESDFERDSTVPFNGGWFLYLGYELATEVEPSLQMYRDTALPIAFAARCKHAIVFDRQTEDCFFVSESTGRDEYDSICDDISACSKTKAKASIEPIEIREEPPSKFKNAVVTAKEHIAAGDVYQANLSRAWRASLPPQVPAKNIYQALSSTNPAPFAGLVHWKGASIICSSPERLVEVRAGHVSTRPIAGTRPRSIEATDDASLSAELISHPKERAEHVMLIDLERNDLGRVCKPGSVVVDEMMVLESYAHVHHIVSNVSGELRDDVLPSDTIGAVFPGGTITGCPKVRCMEIIDTLEGVARGAYTGSIGYLNRNGDMDLNILIRTMVKAGDAVSFRAGAGIVADSDPQGELRETRAKAKGMINALLLDEDE